MTQVYDDKLWMQQVGLGGIITPTQLTGNTNNWAPTGLSGAAVIRISSDAARQLTGITGGAGGRMLLLVNVGSFTITLINDATSTAANRFLSDSNVSLLANGAVLLWYDSTTSRWRVASRS